MKFTPEQILTKEMRKMLHASAYYYLLNKGYFEKVPLLGLAYVDIKKTLVEHLNLPTETFREGLVEIMNKFNIPYSKNIEDECRRKLKMDPPRKSINSICKPITNEITRTIRRTKISDEDYECPSKEINRRKRLDRPKTWYDSREWLELRYKVIKEYGAKCMCCGDSKEDGAIIQVDHIKPRSLYPKLELDFDNMQVLCMSCNHGKSNIDETDWRNPKTVKSKRTTKRKVQTNE